MGPSSQPLKSDFVLLVSPSSLEIVIWGTPSNTRHTIHGYKVGEQEKAERLAAQRRHLKPRMSLALILTINEADNLDLPSYMLIHGHGADGAAWRWGGADSEGFLTRERTLKGTWLTCVDSDIQVASISRLQWPYDRLFLIYDMYTR